MGVVEWFHRVDALWGCEPLFPTYCFLLLFLPAAIVGYWVVPNRTWKLGYLVLASCVFYAFFDIRFLPLLLVSSMVDFLIGLRLPRSPRPKRWLWGSVAFNLGVLGFFKYAMFTADNARSLFDLLGVPIELPGFHIILPIGISFYTFQTMSYTLDVYRGRVAPTRSFLKYLCFVTMFPQLVAGPIVRYATMDEQLDELPRSPVWGAAAAGATVFVLGLAKKVLVADTIARSVDPLWAEAGGLGTAAAWYAAVGYTTQLYFDFSGYSDMAIGLGAMLGFTFPVNFRAPHHSLNPSEWWRRWHITLSTFFRDYIYIPLGGNRVDTLRLYRNLMAIMVVSGLWHGSSWNFILFGIYHGLLLILYQRVQKWWDAGPRRLQQAAMMTAWVLGLVLFRAPDLDVAGTIYQALFSMSGWSLPGVGRLDLAILAAAFGFTLVARPLADRTFRLTWWQAIAVASLFTASLVMIGSGHSPFLYYQF